MADEIAVLIVAAGAGERAGGGLPKQYQALGELSVLEHSIRTFQSHRKISEIQVVINEAHLPYYSALKLTKDISPPVPGGATRQDSVRRGLEALKERSPQFVLIHDAARPFVSHDMIDRILAALQTHEAVVPAVAVTDTIKEVSGDTVVGTIKRETLRAVQTPQGFRFHTILQLHNRFIGESLTDDTALAEKAKIAVHIVPGEYNNNKITTAADLNAARQRVGAAMDIRTGMGFDVHRLIDHEKEAVASQRILKICGVPIAHDRRLEGHSDADVGYHALVDAILGAIGEGDIGLHFPPSDPRWRGADSSRFMLHAYKLMVDKNAILLNADITIICEKPRITAHREAMVENIAKLLHVDKTRVNIKSTTTERLGFTGRGEGIAAQAVVSVRVG